MLELSVIIPTRNRPVHLAGVLGGLAGQNFDPHRYEVIVVDNAPTNELRPIVSDYQTKVPYPLSYLWEPSPGLHRARHTGMRAAKADLLVFADDDIVPFATWLKAIYEAFSTTDAVLVGGKNLPKWEQQPPRWIREMWEPFEGIQKAGYLSILDLGEEPRVVDPFFVWGCNFSIRKSVLLEAKGFHPDGMPDELLQFRGDGETYVSRFIAERGYRAFYHPLANVFHVVPANRLTLEYFQQRAYKQGISDSFTRLRAAQSAETDSVPSRDRVFQLIDFGSLRRLFNVFVPERTRRNASIHDAYLRGRAWHCDLFHKDAMIRNWVLKPDYLND